jgi:hypothetical protein
MFPCSSVEYSVLQTHYVCVVRATMHWHYVSTRAQILCGTRSAKRDSQTLLPACLYRVVPRNYVVGDSEIGELSRDHINRDDLSRDHINRDDLSRERINRDDLSRDRFFIKAVLKWGELLQQYFTKKKILLLWKMFKNIKWQMTILGGVTSSFTIVELTWSSRVCKLGEAVIRKLASFCIKRIEIIVHKDSTCNILRIVI